MNVKRQHSLRWAIAALLAGAVTLAWTQKTANERALAEAERERDTLLQRVSSLENHLGAERQRTTAVENDNVRLLKAVETAAASRAAKPVWEPTTHASVDARMRRAREQLEAGGLEGALREYLWCLDTGYPLLNNSGAVALAAIVKLGETYPPALVALRERREQAAQRILTGEDVFGDAWQFDRLNRTLQEQDRTLALYDTFPRDDLRRREMGRLVFESLVGERRYAEALETMPVEIMRQHIRQALPPPAAPGTEALRAARWEAQRVAKAKIAALDPAPAQTEPPTAARIAAQKLARERAGQAVRNAVVAPTARHIEVLAGANEVEAARELAGLLTEYDPSEATAALVRKHLARAGRPALLK